MKQLIGILLGVAAVVAVVTVVLQKVYTPAEVREDFICGEE